MDQKVIKKVISVRKYKKGYHTVTYIVDGSSWGCPDLTMTSAFTNKDLSYIGDSKFAHRLYNYYNLSDVQPARAIQKSIVEKTIDQQAKILLEGNLLVDYSFQPACSLGFNIEQQKWYGWSHRAIYGFGIGSECKKEDVCYRSSNKEDFIKETLMFWNFYADGTWISPEMGRRALESNVKFSVIKEIVLDIPDPYSEIEGSGFILDYDTHVKDSRDILNHRCWTPYPEKWGRGEWTATSLEEAKEMAIDFAKGVS